MRRLNHGRADVSVPLGEGYHSNRIGRQPFVISVVIAGLSITRVITTLPELPQA